MIPSSMRIFFTKNPPVTKTGKMIPSVWKKADILTDFFYSDTGEKNAINSSLQMLFDTENLYVAFSNTLPASFRSFPEKDPGIQGSAAEVFFATGKNFDQYLCVQHNEKGGFKTVINDRETVIPEIKNFFSLKEKKETCTIHSLFIIPLSLLHVDLSSRTPSIDFSAMYSHPDQMWQLSWANSHILSPDPHAGDNFYGTYLNMKYWEKAVFAKKSAPAKKISAKERMEKENRKSILYLDTAKTGRPYKNILGMNNSPRVKSAALAPLEKALFKKLAPARVRHHDAALNDCGYALIDVTRLFPLFQADHNDPQCYDFGPTDLYLRYVKECGIPIEFRFGESIEHSETTFRVAPPKDREKWVEICINILRHYMEGWANGMKLSITHASLWEEPDNKRLFSGSFDDEYLPLYRSFATALKKHFPEIKVGGPQAIRVDHLERFTAYCRKYDLPLDFLSTTSYSRIPEDFLCKAKRMRVFADHYGYKNIEIFFAEWHYRPRSWARSFLPEREKSENAAFSVSALMEMQQEVDMAYFYEWASYGFYGLYSDPHKPFMVYYALCFYTEFIRKKGRALLVNIPENAFGVKLLASREKTGKVNVLLSRFKSTVDSLEFHLPQEYKKCKMKMVTDSSPAGEKEISFRKKGKTIFSIPFPDRAFGVYLLEFDKE